MRRPPARPLAWTLAGLVLLGAESGRARAADVPPGAYCPFPKAGEAPKCMIPARAEYGGFFEAVDAGSIDDAQAARVEADLAAGGDEERAYLALSSLAYGYYRLARLAAESPEAEAAVLARLERWNDLLSATYAASDADAPLRGAIRDAATDLHARAPAVGLACVDERGEPARCDSTEAVLRSLGREREQTGVRGALHRLLGRLFGTPES